MTAMWRSTIVLLAAVTVGCGGNDDASPSGSDARSSTVPVPASSSDPTTIGSVPATTTGDSGHGSPTATTSLARNPHGVTVDEPGEGFATIIPPRYEVGQRSHRVVEMRFTESLTDADSPLGVPEVVRYTLDVELSSEVVAVRDGVATVEHIIESMRSDPREAWRDDERLIGTTQTVRYGEDGSVVGRLPQGPLAALLSGVTRYPGVPVAAGAEWTSRNTLRVRGTYAFHPVQNGALTTLSDDDYAVEHSWDEVVDIPGDGCRIRGSSSMSSRDRGNRHNPLDISLAAALTTSVDCVTARGDSSWRWDQEIEVQIASSSS